MAKVVGLESMLLLPSCLNTRRHTVLLFSCSQTVEDPKPSPGQSLVETKPERESSTTKRSGKLFVH